MANFLHRYLEILNFNNKIKVIKLRIAVKTILAIVPAVALAWGLFQFSIKPDEDRELRLPASTLLRAIDSEDYGSSIENAGDGTRIWAIRSPANNRSLGEELVLATQYILDMPAIIGEDLVENGLAEKMIQADSANPRILNSFSEQTGSDLPAPMLALSQDYNEALDYYGHPVRWGTAENLIAGYTRFRSNHYSRENSKPATTSPLPAIPRSNRVNYYRGLVENFARRYNLNTSLVMAIIHSESDFSPAIVSNKSAMGLMQLLPSTASDEVHRFLYGRRGQIGFEDLRNPEINIRYGTAYLHILLNRYFANVRNRDVQEVCAIASYNLGPNRFLRLYGATNEQAVEKINSMSEDDFYEDLIRRLPARETRFFVQKVRRMKKHYSSLPQATNQDSGDN